MFGITIVAWYIILSKLIVIRNKRRQCSFTNFTSLEELIFSSMLYASIPQTCAFYERKDTSVRHLYCTTDTFNLKMLWKRSWNFDFSKIYNNVEGKVAFRSQSE